MEYSTETNKTLKEYIDTHIETTDSKRDFVSVKKIRHSYNRWLMQNNYNTTKSILKEFRNRLSEYLYFHREKLGFYAPDDFGTMIKHSNVFTNIKYKTI
jgi:hypothetical protein